MPDQRDADARRIADLEMQLAGLAEAFKAQEAKLGLPCPVCEKRRVKDNGRPYRYRGKKDDVETG